MCDTCSDEHGITPSGSYEVRLRSEAALHTFCTAAWRPGRDVISGAGSIA